MQLLIVAKKISHEFLEKLKSFKYKNEVKVLQDITKEDQVIITAAAYAFVYAFSGDYVYPVTAIRSGVPVIVSDAGALPEICGDAALYVNAADHKNIADKMMLVFKDEKLRKQLIEKGKVQIKKYNWDIAAEQLLNCIKKAIN